MGAPEEPSPWEGLVSGDLRALTPLQGPIPSKPRAETSFFVPFPAPPLPWPSPAPPPHILFQEQQLRDVEQDTQLSPSPPKVMNPAFRANET